MKLGNNMLLYITNSIVISPAVSGFLSVVDQQPSIRPDPINKTDSVLLTFSQFTNVLCSVVVCENKCNASLENVHALVPPHNTWFTVLCFAA